MGTDPRHGDDRGDHRADDLRADLAAVAEATERLLETVGKLTDEDLRAPSRLPGWTRGHVLTHLARNADGMRNLVTWARTGRETLMYPSREARDADIEAGAGRPVQEQLADLTATAERLAAALADLPDTALDTQVRLGSGTPVVARALGYHRLRELEIHHVDLDAGFTPAHWPAAFTLRTLDVLAPFFRAERNAPVRALAGLETGRTWEIGAAGPVLRGPESALLAWLTGRSDGDGLVSDAEGPVLRAPRWA